MQRCFNVTPLGSLYRMPCRQQYQVYQVPGINSTWHEYWYLVYGLWVVVYSVNSIMPHDRTRGGKVGLEFISPSPLFRVGFRF